MALAVMDGHLHSASWYRVASLKPALRRHARLYRHVYRRQPWYVLHDPVSGRSHRFPAAAQRLINMMDGQRTVREIWEAAGDTPGDDLPTQDEVIQLLAQLYAIDVLRVDVPPDARELFERHEKRERLRRHQRFGNPLALRFRLWDPDAFLHRTLPYVRPLFSRIGLLAWLAVVATGVMLAALHWRDLTGNFSDRLFTLHNLVVVWLAYPLIKAAHELGHAYATKVRGGEVHEIGIMLIVFMPVPYVDASSAAAFPDKWHRVTVGAAGIAVEMFVAGLAMVVWTLVEPGAIRALAFNLAVIGGISTLVFNGNPLLRYDGYYVLADLLEIPNLGMRANQYAAYLARRYLFGLAQARSPGCAPGERRWLLGYAPFSFVYRVVLTVAIGFYVAGKFLVLGTLLATYVVATTAVLPIGRFVLSVLREAGAAPGGSRAIAIMGTVPVILVLVFFLVPVPLSTRSEGVSWLPPQAEVHAGANATVVRLLTPPGSAVGPGTPLIETADPALPVRVAVLDAQVREVEARYQAALAVEPAKAPTVEAELAAAVAELRLARQREGELVIRSPARGIFVVPEPEDLPGRFIHQGDLVAYIADVSGGTVVATVSQANVGLIRSRTRRVSVRFAHAPGKTFAATIRREVPAGTNRLPSPALGTLGGGTVAVDPGDATGTKTVDKVFQVELALSQPLGRLGERAYVSFDHGTEPLAGQWYRRVRQLFLSRLDV